MEEYTPTGTTSNIPEYTPTKVKKLTIEEYKKRQLANKESRILKIPKSTIIKKQHKRGGRKNYLLKKIAILKKIVQDEENPPSWNRATEIYQQIDNLKAQLKAKNGKLVVKGTGDDRHNQQ